MDPEGFARHAPAAPAALAPARGRTGLQPYDPGQHDPGPLRPVLDWVDARFGPFYGLAGMRFAPPDPPWWLYMCSLARAPVGMWFVPDPVAAGGASREGDAALRRTLGEAVERYSGLNADFTDELVMAPASESRLAARFPRCAPDEKCPPTFRGPDNVKEPLTHVPATRLADGTEELVPAGYVLLDFWPSPPEPAVVYPISTGMAFHTDLVRALWAGLCEAAERDGFMLMWWTQRPAREIVCEGSRLPAPLYDRVRSLRAIGLTPRLFDISSDVRIPAVTCFLLGEKYPYLSAGAACTADPLQACAKALDEAVYVRVPSQSRPKDAREVPSTSDFNWVQQLDDHRALYAAWPSPPATRFLLDRGNGRVSFADYAAEPWCTEPATMSEFESLARRLERDQGLTLLWKDMTVPEVEGLGRVVKVVVPEMIPLSPNQNVRWLGMPRLLEALGRSRARAADFNPYPHPFP